MRGERLRGYGLALVAAALWATLGLFYHQLAQYGLSRTTIVFFRAGLTAAILLPLLAWRQPRALHLQRRWDWLWFAAYGLLGVAAFFALYIHAIVQVGMGMAAVLMYTAPAWVTLFGTLFLGERLTAAKIVALVLACGGCALVSRVYSSSAVGANVGGILAGLGAGLTYALYTVFSHVAQKRYTPWGSLTYALGWGALFLLPFQPLAAVARALTTPPTLLWLLLLAAIPTLAAGVAFNAALRWVPASNASVVATLEPAIAALLGWAVLGERMEGLQLVGAGLILTAVLWLQRIETRMNTDPHG